MFIKRVHYCGLFVNNWDVVWHFFCDCAYINRDSIC